jgi:hypothetical protein
MLWWQFALPGAGSGGIVQVLAVFGCVAVWQDARRNRSGRIKLVPPGLRRYVDVSAHAIMPSARVVLGTAAALLCGIAGHVTGQVPAEAAVAAGEGGLP